jgi:hypothetical protein
MTTIDPAAVDALLARARREVDEGLLPSSLREHRRTTALGSLAARCAA